MRHVLQSSIQEGKLAQLGRVLVDMVAAKSVCCATKFTIAALAGDLLVSPAPHDSTLMPGSHKQTATCLQVCLACPSHNTRHLCHSVLESRLHTGNVSIAIRFCFTVPMHWLQIRCYACKLQLKGVCLNLSCP